MMMSTEPNPVTVSTETSTGRRGLIFNIMRFCLHDGPGTRTTVFFKGCPLGCWWCHNPEGRSAQPDLMFFENRCVLCGECLNACPHGVIVQEDGVMRTTEACHACGTCVDVCAAGARELAGHWMSIPEVLDEIEKDRLFWDESGGGVTFSGGEPFLQPHFLDSLLDACQARHIHTAVETCGYVKRDLLLRLSSKADLFLFDLKLLDSEKHRANTGRGNESILANLRALAQASRPLIVRYPVIPGVNDDEENVKQMMMLLRSLGLGCVHLLPFHPTGAAKYRRLRLLNPLTARGRETENNGSLTSLVEHVAQEFSRHGFEVRIGG
jgi:pyruvate formate lyase activating enzyme